MGEKVYYRYLDEQGYLGESRVLITILSRAMFTDMEGKAKEKRRTRCSIQEAKYVLKRTVTKLSGFYQEEPLE